MVFRSVTASANAPNLKNKSLRCKNTSLTLILVSSISGFIFTYLRFDSARRLPDFGCGGIPLLHAA